jgi:hypothetical protein
MFSVFRSTAAILALAAVVTVFGQAPSDEEKDKKREPPWDTTMARGATREVDFATSEDHQSSINPPISTPNSPMLISYLRAFTIAASASGPMIA